MQRGPVTSTLYHGTPVIPRKTSMPWYCCSQNKRSPAILARRLCSESRISHEITVFSRENLRWAQQLVKWTPGLIRPLSRSR